MWQVIKRDFGSQWAVSRNLQESRWTAFKRAVLCEIEGMRVTCQGCNQARKEFEMKGGV